MLMHDGQLTVSIRAVRELVRLQFPQWQGLPVRAVASDGTVNAIFRIGAGLAARFPLQPAEVAATRQSLESEASAARHLIGRTRFRTPEPIAIGEPGAGYPLPWSVRLAPADPALDLVGAWHGLATGPRQEFRAVLDCDDLEWARGAAWAFEQALRAACTTRTATRP